MKAFEKLVKKASKADLKKMLKAIDAEIKKRQFGWCRLFTFYTTDKPYNYHLFQVVWKLLSASNLFFCFTSVS